MKPRQKPKNLFSVLLFPTAIPSAFLSPMSTAGFFPVCPPSFQFECFRGTLCQGKHGISNKSLVRGFAL
jgi:hypothetical protein